MWIKEVVEPGEVEVAGVDEPVYLYFDTVAGLRHEAVPAELAVAQLHRLDLAERLSRRCRQLAGVQRHIAHYCIETCAYTSTFACY